MGPLILILLLGGLLIMGTRGKGQPGPTTADRRIAGTVTPMRDNDLARKLEIVGDSRVHMGVVDGEQAIIASTSIANRGGKLVLPYERLKGRLLRVSVRVLAPADLPFPAYIQMWYAGGNGVQIMNTIARDGQWNNYEADIRVPLPNFRPAVGVISNTWIVFTPGWKPGAAAEAIPTSTLAVRNISISVLD